MTARRTLITALASTAILVAVAVPALGASGMPAGPYRTDAQAESYLEHARGGTAWCANGYYSQRETRTGRHFRQGPGQRFRSFTCTWNQGGRSSAYHQLYLQTRPHSRWVVQPDH